MKPCLFYDETILICIDYHRLHGAGDCTVQKTARCSWLHFPGGCTVAEAASLSLPCFIKLHRTNLHSRLNIYSYQTPQKLVHIVEICPMMKVLLPSIAPDSEKWATCYNSSMKHETNKNVDIHCRNCIRSLMQTAESCWQCFKLYC